MSNTIAGVNLAQIAQRSLDPLTALFAPLNALTTDFSADVSAAGESVTTRFATRPTAQDLSGGFTPTDVSMTARTIALNTYYGFVAAFTDLERSKSSIALDQLFIGPMLQALGKKVFGDVWNLVTAANFPTYYTSTAANFDRSDLIDVAATLTNTLQAPKMDRSFVANNDFYAALLKTLNSAEIPGITLDKQEGIVPRVSGFESYETTEADANGEYLGAFGMHKSALIMAGRRVDASGASSAGVEISDVVIPGLNLPVQFRRWYSPNDGQLRISCGLLYGVQKGTGMGVRVVTQ